jgi:beta-mannosidase
MMNEGNFHLMVVNTQPKDLAGLKARVRVLNLDGTVKSDHTVPMAAAALAATDGGAIDFPADISPVHFVKVELHDAAGKLVSDNFYWEGLQSAPDDLTALDGIATAALDAKLARHDADGKCLIDVTLSNPTKVIAVMAHLQLRKAGGTDRVLPVFYTDNYVSLLPGESKTITIEASSANVGPGTPVVMLDGWNVTTKAQSFTGASVAVNAAAFPANHQP